jgi:lysyl-tRNA synthetase class 2
MSTVLPRRALAARLRADQPPRPERWTVRLLALAVLLAGTLDLVSASSAEIESRVRAVRRVVPAGVPPLASITTNVVGAALILLVPSLLRRKRRALMMAVTLLLVSTVLNLVKGGDYEEATVTTLVAIALLLRRRDFPALGDPTTRPRLVAACAAVVAVVYGYGTAVLVFHHDSRPPVRLLGEVTRRLLGANAGLPAHPDLDGWYPWSLRLLALAGVAYVARLALRPWRVEQEAVARDRHHAAEIVAEHGADTLSYFALRSDKRYFFSPDRSAFLAYRLVAGTAVVSGDPVGPPAARERCLDEFILHAHARGWHLAVLGAAEPSLGLYRARGLRCHYEGDEAIVDVERFSLDGRAIRKVRQSVTRLEREGYAVLVRRADEVGPSLRRAMEGIADLWRRGRPETGFSMAMDRIFAPDGEDDASLFVIAVDRDGIPQGFLHFVPAPAGRALSLSSMRRYRDTPNGLNEFLVVRSIEWARENGIERVSLNFAAFAALLGDDPDGLTVAQRLERAMILRLQQRFQLTRLLDYNRKFSPDWQRRYVVYETGASLPRVGLAAMIAEGYLTLPGMRRSTP